MSSVHLVTPLLLPLMTAIAALLAWHTPVAQRRLGVAGAAGLLVSAVLLFRTILLHGPQSTQIGDWPAPFGITLVADLMSGLLVVVAGIIGLAVTIYSLDDIDPERESFGYHPLLHVLMTGIVGAFLTGDLFNLYVWFEVMLIASFVLLALGGERPQLEGAVKYVTMNLVASALLLSAIAILYGLTGTLNMADLAGKLRSIPESGLLNAVALLFLTAFGVKAAIFPLFFWLPASYHTPPAVISALFAGLLTKVGVYAIIRVFTLLFIENLEFTHTLILVVAGLTMVTGVLGAVAQHEFRRLLSFQIISEVGYLLIGLGLFTRAGLSGTVYFLAHVMLAESALFFVSGLARKAGGSYDLERLGGLAIRYPVVAVLFLIPALSLVGIPPLSGLFAKLALVKAGLDVSQFLIVATALIVSLLTLYAMTKIWNEAFWAPAQADLPRVVLGTPMLLSTGALAAMTVLMGLAAEPLFGIALQAADQLLTHDLYVAAVLGKAR
jgi:multicomponent Na+:H+ antiporter subunit D